MENSSQKSFNMFTISTNKGQDTYKTAGVRYRHLVKYKVLSKTY